MEFDNKSLSLAAAAFAAVVALPLLASAGPAPTPQFSAEKMLWHCGSVAKRLPDRVAFLRR